MRKHAPFKSIYRENTEVVEERCGPLGLYPHTEQLPILYRALSLEFYGGLPDKIARVDSRANDYHKILLQTAVQLFCNIINGNRNDHVRLTPVYTPDLVTRIAIVQHITESCREGRVHRFRLFSGADFWPDIHLGGKRIAFASHLFDRFNQRAPHYVQAERIHFFDLFFGSAAIILDVSYGRARAHRYEGSMLIFPFKETKEEFFFTTCLTVKEISELVADVPVRAPNLHYGSAYTRPVLRNWSPEALMFDLAKCNNQKLPFTPPPATPPPAVSWAIAAGRIKRLASLLGRKEHSRIRFLDNIHGPVICYYDNPSTGAPELFYDQKAECKKLQAQGLLPKD